MTAPLLQVENLSVTFLGDKTRTPAVDDMSFTVAPGETLALVGESGSGKSVTALSIMRLLPASIASVSGTIRLDGTDMLSASDARIRDIRGDSVGMIFQEPMTSLNPVLTVGQQIAEVLIRHRGLRQSSALKEAAALLAKVQIPDPELRLVDYPHRLSGGMRQRVMIAMAIACKPKLLIADEPTTALDVTIQAQILDLLKALQAEYGMAVLFITHDLGVVSEIADRTIVMYGGRSVEENTTRELFASPQHSYTSTLLAAVPRLGVRAAHGGQAEQKTVDEESPGKPLLKVRNLTTRFDVRRDFLGRVLSRVHAVEDVSLDLHEGETLAVVGESGCGKSTLARSIMRLVDIHSGTIELDDKDVATLSGNELRLSRRAMQMVFQDPFASLDPTMRVGDQIAEPILTHGLMDRSDLSQAVATLLRQVGLSPDHASRYPHEFSGGQRQRLCLARALGMRPKIIVADEAVSALDASVKAQVVELMERLQQELGIAYLFISHDMAIVEKISHRVAVMYVGEIVEIGPRQSVFGNPQHPYTRRLLAAVPTFETEKRREIVAAEEVGSRIRAPGYAPPARRYQKVGTNHIVQAWQ